MSFITKHEVACEKQMKGAQFFSNVAVLVAHHGDLAEKVKTALNKIKLLVVVEMIGGKVAYANLGPEALDNDTVFTIEENVLLNRAQGGTNKTAMDCVEEVLLVFNPSQPKGTPCLISSWKLINDNDGVLKYQVYGSSKAGFKSVT